MINGLIKLFYSEIVKTNIKKMPSGEYALKEQYKEIKNLTVKIDSLALKSIKLILCIMILILSFEINTILGIGVFLIEFLYIIYKRNLEKQILDKIENLKKNIEIPTLDILTEKGKSLAKEILDDKEILRMEKETLEEISLDLTEDKIKEISERWKDQSAEN